MARKDDLNYAHSEDGGDVGLESAPHERSATAKEIADLQDKILKFARNRDYLNLFFGRCLTPEYARSRKIRSWSGC
jgi:hypothetical protein